MTTCETTIFYGELWLNLHRLKYGYKMGNNNQEPFTFATIYSLCDCEYHRANWSALLLLFLLLAVDRQTVQSLGLRVLGVSLFVDPRCLWLTGGR